MMTDPIADFLTRIRNGLQAKHAKVAAPMSQSKERIAKILKEEGYISDFNIEQVAGRKEISISLKYHNGESVIDGIKRASKPGLRLYRGSNELPVVRGGLGTVVVSTSKGVMTGREAKKQKVGGELLCYVW